MKLELPDRNVNVFSVMSRQETRQEYFTDDIKPAIRLSDEYGYSGMLLFQSNRGNIEPWVFAQEVLANSVSLCPIVAVNPVYMHPFTVAKKILTLCGFYRRKIYLNLITGTSKSDLAALNDHLEHDDRYRRLVEYATIIDALLRETGPVSFSGRYYTVSNLQLSSGVPEALLPEYFVAGSSHQAQVTRNTLGATKLSMAKQDSLRYHDDRSDLRNEGVHFGIIARAEERTAQTTMKQRFPESKSNQEILAYSMKNTDAVWKQALRDSVSSTGTDSTYSLVPFKNFKADCPYHVGSYEQVAEVIAQYVECGISTFIIEIPPGEAEYQHTAEVFRRAQNQLVEKYNPASSHEFEFKF